jgi:hypothetical protein
LASAQGHANASRSASALLRAAAERGIERDERAIAP